MSDIGRQLKKKDNRTPMEDTTREEFGQNQTANLAGADVDDDGCEGVKMREGGLWVWRGQLRKCQ